MANFYDFPIIADKKHWEVYRRNLFYSTVLTIYWAWILVLALISLFSFQRPWGSVAFKKLMWKWSTFVSTTLLMKTKIKKINPFVPNAPFLYPLKTSENLTVFWCFQGVGKRCIGSKWIKFTNNEYMKIFSICSNFHNPNGFLDAFFYKVRHN